VHRIASGGVREVILATNPSLEGEATALYVQRQLASYPLSITRVARVSFLASIGHVVTSLIIAGVIAAVQRGDVELALVNRGDEDAPLSLCEADLDTEFCQLGLHVCLLFLAE